MSKNRHYRIGPRSKDCMECFLYRLKRDSFEKHKWLIQVDGRITKHIDRHVEWFRKRGFEYEGQLDDDLKKCDICSDAFRYQRNYRQAERGMVQRKRHYELHDGYDNVLKGWYEDEWKAKEDLRHAEFTFFEMMNYDHIVNRGWHWLYGGWEAVQRGCGGFEQVWHPRSDTPHMYEAFFGYPNNARYLVGDFPHKMELIG